MQPKTLGQFKALVFDVYGTLVDWESGIYNGLKPLLDRVDSKWTKQEALIAFESVEKDLQVQNPSLPYNELLAETHKAFASRLDSTSTPEEDSTFGHSISHWNVFPDTVAALAKLKKYYRLMVLSNVDNASFNTFTRPLLEPEGLGTIFDLVMTAQDVGAYKPDPAMLQSALNALDRDFSIKAEEVLMTAESLFHDHKTANALRVNSAWIERPGAYLGMDNTATFDFKFSTLGEMADARENERS